MLFSMCTCASIPFRLLQAYIFQIISLRRNAMAMVSLVEGVCQGQLVLERIQRGR